MTLFPKTLEIIKKTDHSELSEIMLEALYNHAITVKPGEPITDESLTKRFKIRKWQRQRYQYYRFDQRLEADDEPQ